MNIWNKVFLVLIFLLALVAVFFAAQEMKIRGAGQRAVASFEKQQIEAEKEIEKIYEGTAPEKAPAEKTFEEMGFEESRLKLFDLLFERKKAWFGCKPGGIKPDGKILTPEQLGGNSPATPGDKLKPVHLLEARITITEPVIEQDGNEVVVPPEDLKGIVYVFDEGEEGVGGSFLGIFTVDGAPQKAQSGYQVTLHSANELNQTEVQRIQRAARSTWAVYASVPIDRYEGIFDRLSEEDAETIPAAIRNKIMNPERSLTDFGEMLTRLYQWRVVLQQEIDSSKKDIASLNASLEIAAKEDQKLREDIEFEKKRIAAMDAQREAIRKMVQQYDATIKQLQEDIEQTQGRNEWYVAEIAKYQLRVKEEIEKKAKRETAE